MPIPSAIPPTIGEDGSAPGGDFLAPSPANRHRALNTCRFGTARFGSSRFGFSPDGVKPPPYADMPEYDSIGDQTIDTNTVYTTKTGG